MFITLMMVTSTMSTDEVLPMNLKCQGIPALSTELRDSGMYDCYDGRGSREVAYQLIVNGILLFVTTLNPTADGIAKTHSSDK